MGDAEHGHVGDAAIQRAGNKATEERDGDQQGIRHMEQRECACGSERGASHAAAGAFALFHMPNPLLVTVTLLGGFVSCTLYRRVPNVPVLRIAHAMISPVLLSALP